MILVCSHFRKVDCYLSCWGLMGYFYCLLRLDYFTFQRSQIVLACSLKLTCSSLLKNLNSYCFFLLKFNSHSLFYAFYSSLSCYERYHVIVPMIVNSPIIVSIGCFWWYKDHQYWTFGNYSRLSGYRYSSHLVFCLCFRFVYIWYLFLQLLLSQRICHFCSYLTFYLRSLYC